jgi:putative inorganic carbon (hco3(-)) transporter
MSAVPVARRDEPLAGESRNGVLAAAELVTRYALVAIVLTLPLEFTAAPFRQPLVRWVLVIAAAAFVLLVVSGARALAIPRRASVVVLALYVVMSLASWAVTRAPGSTNALLDVAFYPVAAWLMFNLARTPRDHRLAWVAFVGSALAIAVLGMLLTVFHLHIWTPNPIVANRLNITFADPNITARFLTLGAAAAVLMFSERQGPAWLSVAAAVACGVVLPLTLSRSGLALFVISVVLALVVARDRKRALVISVAALMAFGASTGINPQTRDRAAYAIGTVTTAFTGAAPATSASDPVGSIAIEDNRKYLIAAGLQMFVDHPVVGVGFGGYQHALLGTYKRYLPQNYIDSLSHTAAVTVLAEQGVLGGLAMLAFLLVLAFEALRAMGPRGPTWVWTALPATMVVPIFLYSQFEGRFFQEPYFWLVLALVYSSFTLAREGGKAPRQTP